MTKALTQEMLQSILHYNPETGVFTYLNDSKHKEAGQEAGYIKSQGYREIHVAGKNYYAHRLAFLFMTGSFPKECVDHINNNRLDNRWCNLRNATRAENMRNRPKLKSNTSGVTGVCWQRAMKKWCAYINLNRKRHELGHFDSLDEAASVVKAARERLHGEFAHQEQQ
ncbi:HNH endonuclease [Paraburkholderia sediminicola]|uniref:HNH endonuclease n=1 Tax=Paraburkholderia sediminicola TaxID=458836 RepID=UPI0038BC0267